MDANHTLLAKKFEEEVNSFVKSGLERQLAKKRPNVFANEIFEFFFLLKILLRRMMCSKNKFCNTLVC